MKINGRVSLLGFIKRNPHEVWRTGKSSKFLIREEKEKKKKKDIQFVSTVDIIESVSSGFFPRIKKKETKEK